MIFSYNFLQSFFKEKLPAPDKLGELLMMHFFEVESVVKKDNDYAIDIDILASRAGDCFSHIGIAREVAAITGLEYELKERKVKEGKEDIEDRTSVTVRDACNRYTLRGVTNVKVGPSPKYIQDVLKTCNINPINNVVDITNYVMLETGQPLHAFDAEKLEGEKIIVRYAKKREKIVTLDEKRYDLQENILVIADELSPVGIAGIKGGVVPEVDENTKTIYIEAGNFDSLTIRRGSRDLKLRTDASLRFEHGLPLELTEIAVDRAASMMADIAKGEVLKGLIDYKVEINDERDIEFSVEDLRKVLGVEVSIKEIERILRSLEFVFKRDGSQFYAAPPYFRKDISIKEDIYEEVGRIYGYDKIDPEFPKEKIKMYKEDNFFEREMKIRRLFKEMGFSESYNYSFVNEERSIFFDKKRLIEVEKPVSLEFKYLRPSLYFGLLSNLAENEKNVEKVDIFEIGNVFYKKDDSSTTEEKRLGIISNNIDFYGLKGKLNRFFHEHLFDNVEYQENSDIVFFKKGRSAEIIYDNVELGVFGEVNEKVKKDFKAKGNVLFAEIYLNNLFQFENKVKTYNPISKVPPLIRDIAVLVPDDTPYKDVLEKIKKIGGKTLRRIQLFDYYKGKEIAKNKKSFAFRLYFQLQEKTLSSDEVNEKQQKIMEAVDATSGWKVRK